MSDFALDLSRLIAKANGQAELVVRKIMLDTFTRVVRRTPVDTGRARANWLAGVNAPNTATTTDTDKSGAIAIGKIAAEVQAARVADDVSMYLTNSLAYAPLLENGSSKQAPAGMVRLTLTEIASKYGA